MKKMTHIGILTGDARSGGRKPRVKLRETAKFWVTEGGLKYRKSTGRMATNDAWPMWWLDLDSIKPL